MEFSRCTRRHSAGPSKLNSVDCAEVDVILGELGSRTAEAIERAQRLPT